MIDLIELHIPVEIEQERKMVVSALIPVLRYIRLREMEGSPHIMKPMTSLQMFFRDVGFVDVYIGKLQATQVSGKCHVILK